MRRFSIMIIFFILTAPAFTESVSLMNIISIEGAQDNPVLGYGIVVGLKGSGDSAKGSQTQEILATIANNYGFYVDPSSLQPKNSAIVLVTATIPPFAPVGSRIDVNVSSVFDAKSLEGGELIITPLLGGNNVMYAIAQGSVITTGDKKGVSGIIPKGGIIQNEIMHEIIQTNQQFAIYINQELGLAAVSAIVESIRQKFPDAVKNVRNFKITLKIPTDMTLYDFIAELYKIKVDIEPEPRVLIDAKNGVIVSGGNVVISSAAISFQGTEVEIGTTAAWGTTATGQKKSVNVLPTTTTVSELAEGLNQIGASTEEIITILQLLHKNGNLKARLEIQ